MTKRMLYQTAFAAICSIMVASLASAHEITINDQAAIGNGPVLKAGTYRVRIERRNDSADVSFFLRGKLVATVPAAITKESVTSSYTEVETEEENGTLFLTRILLEGWEESLLFAKGTPKAN